MYRYIVYYYIKKRISTTQIKIITKLFCLVLERFRTYDRFGNKLAVVKYLGFFFFLDQLLLTIGYYIRVIIYTIMEYGKKITILARRR